MTQLEIHVDEKNFLVQIWLTRAEKADVNLRNALIPIYARYKADKYKVAVFLSGEGPLLENTKHLLSINRYRDDAR